MLRTVHTSPVATRWAARLKRSVPVTYHGVSGSRSSSSGTDSDRARETTARKWRSASASAVGGRALSGRAERVALLEPLQRTSRNGAARASEDNRIRDGVGVVEVP